MSFNVGSINISVSVDDPQSTYKMIQKVVDIIGVQNVIAELPVLPEWRDDFLKMEFTRAIHGTLALEGSELTPEELNRIADQDAPSIEEKDKEGENALKAYKFIQEWSIDNQGSDITENVIRQIHTVMTRGINYYLNVPGEYRNQPVMFGIPKRTSELKDRFEVADAMGRLVEFINRKDLPFESYGGHPVAKAILSHYFMTLIHPFIDGNGRVSRAVEALILYHYGGFGDFLFPVSAKFYYHERKKYFTLLRQVDDTGNPHDFIMYAIGGLLANMTNIKEKIIDKITEVLILDYAHQLRRTGKLLKRQTTLLQTMFYLGPMETTSFWNHPAIKGTYEKLSTSTRKRDITNLAKYNFILIEDMISKEGRKKFKIKVNWNLLKRVTLRLDSLPARQ